MFYLVHEMCVLTDGPGAIVIFRCSDLPTKTLEIRNSKTFTHTYMHICTSYTISCPPYPFGGTTLLTLPLARLDSDTTRLASRFPHQDTRFVLLPHARTISMILSFFYLRFRDMGSYLFRCSYRFVPPTTLTPPPLHPHPYTPSLTPTSATPAYPPIAPTHTHTHCTSRHLLYLNL